MIMKKYFIFAAVAAAGLFASCSSSDDIAANDAQNPIEDPNAAPRIRLNIGNVVDMSTRGTGTVGGVGTGTNQWAGQHINVFMFTKNAQKETTLNLTNISEDVDHPIYLYKNTDMVTPGSAVNLIPGMGATANTSDGEAMIKDGTIQYYPLQGNFDFFGYHVDDAATGAVDDQTNAASKWTIPFTINGTQDIMSTKAALRDGQASLVGTDYYSAKAARKQVQPTLTFKHLLSRLQFVLKAGNDAAGGLTGVTPAVYYTQTECDTHNAGLTGALDANETVWTFEAGAPSGQQAWPVNTTGFVKKIKEQDDNSITYTIVQCIKNTTGNNPDPDPFLNAYFALPATDLTALNFNNDVALYAVTMNGVDDYTINAAIAGVSLKGVQASTPAAYNATLTGAWTTSMVKTAASGGTVDATLAVKVTGIQALSANTKGDLAVAWTGDLEDDAKISWTATQPDEAARWLTLMERPAKMYNQNPSVTIAYTDIEAYKDADYANLTEETTPKKSEVDAAIAAAGKRISASVYATLSTAGQGKYTEDNTTTPNDPLVVLTPTSPSVEKDETDPTLRYPETEIGEAIILSPSTADISMKVSVSQLLKTNWNQTDPADYEEKTQTYPLTITAPAGGFKPNTSYKVILTVYGFERIEVHTVIIPWEEGATIPVGQD